MTKFAGQADARGMGVEQRRAQLVEGCHGDELTSAGTQQFAQPIRHFRRGLVGEGDRQDGHRRYAVGLDQMGDAHREGAGLARARSCHDQQRGDRPIRRRRAVRRSAGPARAGARARLLAARRINPFAASQWAVRWDGCREEIAARQRSHESVQAFGWSSWSWCPFGSRQHSHRRSCSRPGFRACAVAFASRQIDRSAACLRQPSPRQRDG